MTAPKLAKRIRRRLYGAKFEFRIYEDGSVRCRVDHPSNDPGTEMALLGIVVAGLGKTFDALGIGPLRPTGPMTWKDDPS
jgi:hypothetical protein